MLKISGDQNIKFIHPVNNKYANFAIILEARKHFAQELENEPTGAIGWAAFF
jgi:hypothetical protein